MNIELPSEHGRPQSSDRPPPGVPEIDSRDLLRGGREIWIRHGQEAYRLSLTRSGKLILRK
ncbi:MAG TPA: hemin uptake protein HemP [Pirellulales bacterium]|nr:hemin uptake protein HemP [Pirellulales bacterium]